MKEHLDYPETAQADSAYPPLYTPFKLLSSRLVAVSYKWPLSSNVITVGWGGLLIVASVYLAFERPYIAFSLVLVAVLLDCLDGDLARRRGQSSISGTLLEQLAHWIGNMALAVGASAAVLLANPSAANVLLAATLAVTQAIYIAVVRQVRSEASNISQYAWLRRVFQVTIKFIWYLSPIELPIVAVFVVFGVTEGTVTAITAFLALSSTVIFVSHFFLIRARDKENWAIAAGRASSFAESTDRLAHLTRVARFPDVSWWAPNAPQLSTEILALTAQQPMSSSAPLFQTIWQELSAQLPLVFRTEGRVVSLGCPTVGACQAVISAFCQPDQEVMVIGGRDTIRYWSGVAEGLGVQITPFDVAFGEGLQLPELKRALSHHAEAKAVILPLSEAEDGTRFDVAAAAEMISQEGRLLIVDACLGLCADDLRMDEWGVDVAISSSSSGLMAPPGLSFVALGPRALSLLDTPELGPGAGCSGTYLDLRTHLVSNIQLLNGLPVPTVGGLHLAVQMILAAGLDGMLDHRAKMAKRFREGCVKDAGLELVCTLQSAACTVALLPDQVTLAEFQGRLFADSRMVFGYGSTPQGEVTIQIGHAGWLFEHDIDQAVKAVASAVRGT